MPRPIYDKLAKMSRAKLDKLEYDHGVHYERFTSAKDAKSSDIQSMDKKYQKLLSKARKDMQESVPKALGTAMEMRYLDADILIAKSILNVLRSNQFYHRMMVMLIQDTKAGVEYDPGRISNIIPAEFSDLIEGSILSTNMDGLLKDLKDELDEKVGPNNSGGNPQ